MIIRKVVALLLLGVLAALPAAAQESQQDMDAMMQEYMEKYATPGEHHKHLEMLAGKWTTFSRAWFVPGTPAQESRGTAEHKMVLGGRFLQTSYDGEFAGMPFAGTGMVAYDRYKQKYVETWGDTMGTMILVSEGTCGGEGKVRTMQAEFDDPMTKRHSTMRSLYLVQDANHYTLEMYGPGPDGKEYKIFVIEHTRVQ
ncbi:MAG: DUF1579 domain-containing protein [Candidatus Acidiferrales bacterium]